MRTSPLEYAVCLALILCSALAWATIDLAEDTASGFLLRQERSLGGVDYKTIPLFSAAGLAVLALANMGLCALKDRRAARASTPAAQPARPAPKAAAEEAAAEDALVRRRTAGTGILLLLYVFLLPLTPFFPLTAVFMCALFWLYGLRDMRKNVLVSCLGAAGFWLLFIRVANLSL